MTEHEQGSNIRVGLFFAQLVYRKRMIKMEHKFVIISINFVLCSWKTVSDDC